MNERPVVGTRVRVITPRKPLLVGRVGTVTTPGFHEFEDEVTVLFDGVPSKYYFKWHTDLEAAAASEMPVLPHDSESRKGIPLATGVLDYFPAALAAVARVSKAGNDKHNPGEPLHWSRGKSTDQADAVARHLLERGGFDPDSGERQSAHLAWRALALLQLEIEEAGEAPLARGAGA